MPPGLADTVQPPRPRRVSRRRLLLGGIGAVLGGGLGIAGWSTLVEPYWTEYVHRDLPVAGLPPHLHGKTLVQLSDLHIGRTDPEHIAGHIARVTALQPHVIVITGDFMSCKGTEQVALTAKLLAPLKARAGVWGIPGNHDYGAGFADVSVAAALQDALAGVGIRLLRNEVADVEGLQLVGVDDFWSPRFDLAAALAGVDPRRPAIVLCHNPDACDEPGWGSFRGWTLAGHTHGGQVKPPFLEPPMLPVKNRRYVAGAYTLADGRGLYINRALGYLRQVRFNVRPEVTVFSLRSDAN